MRNIIILLLFLILIPTVNSWAWEPDEDQIYQALHQIHTEFDSIKRSPSIKKIDRIVEIDRLVRSLVKRFNKKFRNNRDVRDDFYWKPCNELGIRLRGTEDLKGFYMDYDSFPLLLAHAIKPNNRYRSKTLFGGIFYDGRDINLIIPEVAGGGNYMIQAHKPNIAIAKQYLKEFPHGEFAAKTCLILGHYYKDLYIVLRDNRLRFKFPDKFKERIVVSGEGKLFNCYKGELENANKSNYDTLLGKARNKAIDYFSRALNLDASLKEAKKYVKEIKDDHVVDWTYCS